MFDFSFRHFITISFAKVIFVIAMVIACLAYLSLLLLFLGFGSGRGILFGLIVLLFGWIPPAIFLIIVRLGLEFSVANIRTAQNTSQLVGRSGD